MGFFSLLRLPGTQKLWSADHCACTPCRTFWMNDDLINLLSVRSYSDAAAHLAYGEPWTYSSLDIFNFKIYSSSSLVLAKVLCLCSKILVIFNPDAFNHRSIQAHPISAVSPPFVHFQSFWFKSLHIFKLCVCTHSISTSLVFIFFFEPGNFE